MLEFLVLKDETIETLVEPFYLESGRGFLSGEYTKPDFVAQALEVSGKGLRGQYIRETGTSVAAAITAGACAQILEWAVVKQNVLSMVL